MNRRVFLTGVALAATGPAFAGVEELPMTPLPPGADANAALGLSWFGVGRSAIEIFDYNCAYCRAAFAALDARVGKKKLRLGLMDSPQLSPGSVQAAKLRQAAVLLYDPAKAYEFHRRLFAWKGAVDAEAGLAVAQELGLDIAKITDQANAPEVRDRIIAQARFLDKIGVAATPSFIIGPRLLAGWPGPKGFDEALRAMG